MEWWLTPGIQAIVELREDAFGGVANITVFTEYLFNGLHFLDIFRLPIATYVASLRLQFISELDSSQIQHGFNIAVMSSSPVCPIPFTRIVCFHFIFRSSSNKPSF